MPLVRPLAQSKLQQLRLNLLHIDRGAAGSVTRGVDRSHVELHVTDDLQNANRQRQRTCRWRAEQYLHQVATIVHRGGVGRQADELLRHRLFKVRLASGDSARKDERNRTLEYGPGLVLRIVNVDLGRVTSRLHRTTPTT